jgi:hypothetical protein
LYSFIMQLPFKATIRGRFIRAQERSQESCICDMQLQLVTATAIEITTMEVAS